MSQVGRKLPIKTKILPQRRASQWQEAAPNWRLSTDPFIRPFPCAQSVLGVPGPLSPLLSALAPPPLPKLPFRNSCMSGLVTESAGCFPDADKPHPHPSPTPSLTFGRWQCLLIEQVPETETQRGMV